MKVGILGGGQLARMLIQQGQRLGLRMHVLCPGEEDPAALVTRHWHQGSPTKESDLRRFFAQVDVVTFESEFLDALQLQQVAEGTGTPLFPDRN